MISSTLYRWDIGTCRCISRFSNNEATATASMAFSNGILAAGSESGVVNLYSASHTGSDIRPIRSLMNLHTSVDSLQFNHDGQLLAMASRFARNSLRLLHVPSRTVFANWPTSKTPLKYVFDVDFSPSSRYMTVGNDSGACLLYRLRGFSNN